MPTLPAVDAVNSVVLGATLYDADNKMVDAADADGEPEYAMGGWYDYDVSTHVLTPADAVYVLALPGDRWVKLQMLLADRKLLC